MRISVVIPAHNESESIHETVARIIEWQRRTGREVEVVVVDDHSTDSTWQEIRKLEVVAVKRSRGKPGMGRALLDGSRNASGEIIIWTMADGSDSLDSFDHILEAIESGWDMVIASRHIEGGSRGDQSRLKALLSRLYSIMLSIVFREGISDATNAFRGFRREVLEEVELVSGGFSISPELTVKAHLAGYRVGEVPTTYRERKAGRSKFRLVKVAPSYLRVFFSGLWFWLKRKFRQS